MVFFNTNDKEESINDDKLFAAIERKGTYQLNSFTDLMISHTYKGEENPIVISRVYSTSFLCEFNMANYPFDTQICSMILVLKGNSGKHIIELIQP